MIFNLFLRYGITQDFLKDLLKFVNTIFGTNLIPESIYVFRRVMGDNDWESHFYCKNCYYYYGRKQPETKEAVCQVCSKTILLDPVGGNNFFIMFNIKKQIENIIDEYRNEILDYGRQCKLKAENIITDTLNAVNYEKYKKKIHTFTITMNTDGAAVFNATKNTLWPIQCTLNELPPDLRFLFSNRILAGI